MISNLLGRTWATDELIDLVNGLVDDVSITIWCFPHTEVTREEITFKERCVESISISYGDSIQEIQLDCPSNIEYAVYQINNFVNDYVPKTKQPSNIDDLRKQLVRDVKRSLKIDNDYIRYDDKQIQFDLNLYSSKEREVMLKFLSVIDKDTPDVAININLNSVSIEQLRTLSDRLIESKL
jgi:hypothetical protein